MSALHRPLRELLREPDDARQLAAVWQRVAARRSRPTRAPRVMVAAALVAAAVALVPLLRAWHAGAPSTAERPGRVPADQPALRFADGAALGASGTLAAQVERVVQLSDGTRLLLAPGTRLAARAATGTLTAFVLEHGSARFEVAPQRGRRFEVAAGSLQVTVVGTVFSVSAEPAETRVAVEHGRVRVRTPAGEQLLAAGQSARWAEAPQRAATLAAATPVAAGAADTNVGSLRSPAAPAAEPVPSRAPAPGERHPRLGPRGLARGEGAAPDADALFALADSARAAGRPAEAARKLDHLLTTHADDARAPLAALTLARLQLDALGQPLAAARSLRLALALGLPQALHEDALASLVRAYGAGGDQPNAARAAQRYLVSYPRGRFAAEVERWAALRQ